MKPQTQMSVRTDKKKIFLRMQELDKNQCVRTDADYEITIQSAENLTGDLAETINALQPASATTEMFVEWRMKS